MEARCPPRTPERVVDRVSCDARTRDPAAESTSGRPDAGRPAVSTPTVIVIALTGGPGAAIIATGANHQADRTRPGRLGGGGLDGGDAATSSATPGADGTRLAAPPGWQGGHGTPTSCPVRTGLDGKPGSAPIQPRCRWQDSTAPDPVAQHANHFVRIEAFPIDLGSRSVDLSTSDR